MRKGILDIYFENERNHLSKEQNSSYTTKTFRHVFFLSSLFHCHMSSFIVTCQSVFLFYFFLLFLDLFIINMRNGITVLKQLLNNSFTYFNYIFTFVLPLCLFLIVWQIRRDNKKIITK